MELQKGCHPEGRAVCAPQDLNLKSLRDPNVQFILARFHLPLYRRAAAYFPNTRNSLVASRTSFSANSRCSGSSASTSR